jgi:glycosyltransferase involved in cell wall biosynthesis
MLLNNSGDSRKPLVSIITPAFNAGQYIEHTLESAVRQTFGNFELLIVDDGSTDNTFEIASRYAARDPRILVSRQSNRGIASARNAAMARARGRYFALLDSDDLWFPTYLADQLAILEQRPDVDVLSANALNFGGTMDGEPLLQFVNHSVIRRVSLLRLVETEDSMSILSVFRREVPAAIGTFDEGLRRSEDYDFWLRAAAAGFSIAINPRPLGLYRRRSDSLSSDEALMLEAMRRPLHKIRQACLHRPEVQAAVDRQLSRIAERGLVARARHALLTGDMPKLVSHFSALAEATGYSRYRLAGWLSGRLPVTIRLAYLVKRTLSPLARLGRRMAAYTPMRFFWAGDRL